MLEQASGTMKTIFYYLLPVARYFLQSNFLCCMLLSTNSLALLLYFNLPMHPIYLLIKHAKAMNAVIQFDLALLMKVFMYINS